MPRFAIIMPLYNKAPEVARAIRSVLAQSVSDYELVVVDDGSTDDGSRVAEAFRDTRIRVIRQANGGVSAARNRGIDESSADLIAFLDADDEWSAGYLDTIARLAERWPRCGVYATAYSYRSPGRPARRALVRGLPVGFEEGVLSDYFALAASSDPPLWTSAVTVRRASIDGIGGFPVGVASGEDLLTWARLAVNCDIAYSTRPLSFHWDPADLSARRSRRPADVDDVGAGLAALLERADPTQRGSLRQYCALWKRMRGVVYLKQGERRRARAELASAVSYGGSSRRLRVLRCLASIPLGGASFRLLGRIRESPLLSFGRRAERRS